MFVEVGAKVTKELRNGQRCYQLSLQHPNRAITGILYIMPDASIPGMMLRDVLEGIFQESCREPDVVSEDPQPLAIKE